MGLIDADALIERWNNMSVRGRTEFDQEIMVAPSIDIDRPKGEWIDIGDFEQCSVCKGTHLKEFHSYYGKTTWAKTPYCPNCGADMREMEDKDDLV